METKVLAARKAKVNRIFRYLFIKLKRQESQWGRIRDALLDLTDASGRPNDRNDE